MENEKNVIKFCVTYEPRTKLITVKKDGGILPNLKSKISTKFGLDPAEINLRVQLDKYNNLIDIDEKDPDDVSILEEGENLHIFVDTLQKPGGELANSTEELDNAVKSASTSDSIVTARQDEKALKDSGSAKCFNVKDIVGRHPRGREVDIEYTTNGTITTETRRLLTTIICAEMVKMYTYYPTKHQKIKVAESIIEAYPTLRSSTQVPYDIWFDPSDSNRGYISQKLNTMRRNLPHNELLRPRTKERKENISVQTSTQTTKRKYTVLKEIPTVEEEELVLFCKRSPLHETTNILQAMSTSFNNRRNWIALKAPTVPEILSRYPRMQDSPAVLQQEFKLLHPESCNKMITTWETRFCPHIVKLAKISRLPKIQQLVKDLFKESQEDDDSDEDIVPNGPATSEVALFCFIMTIYMVPSQVKRKSSLADSVQYFLVTRPVGTSVETHLAEEQTTKKRSQPYLLGIGPKHNPSQFFVIIDNHAFPCPSDVTEAVDKLFKLHYVFNIKYADELFGFFSFIQNFVYGIKGEEAIPVRAKEMMASIAAMEASQ